MRFQLIDRVLDRTPEKIIAVKTVTATEEYLADHFPGFPVLPGVMMLESLVQAGRLLVDATGEGPPLIVQEVRNVKYTNMIRPGQSLRVEVTMRKRDSKGFEFTGVGKVDEQDSSPTAVAVQGQFRLSPLI